MKKLTSVATIAAVVVIILSLYRHHNNPSRSPFVEEDLRDAYIDRKTETIDIDCEGYSFYSLNLKISRLSLQPGGCNLLLLTNLPRWTAEYKLANFVQALQIIQCPDSNGGHAVHPIIHDQYLALPGPGNCGLTLATVSGQNFDDVIHQTLGTGREALLVSDMMFGGTSWVDHAGKLPELWKGY